MRPINCIWWKGCPVYEKYIFTNHKWTFLKCAFVKISRLLVYGWHVYNSVVDARLGFWSSTFTCIVTNYLLKYWKRLNHPTILCDLAVSGIWQVPNRAWTCVYLLWPVETLQMFSLICMARVLLSESSQTMSKLKPWAHRLADFKLKVRVCHIPFGYYW